MLSRMSLRFQALIIEERYAPIFSQKYGSPRVLVAINTKLAHSTVGESLCSDLGSMLLAQDTTV